LTRPQFFSREKGWAEAKLDTFTVFSITSKDLFSSLILSPNCVEFEGACLDTGAGKSVIGRQQAIAYFKFLGKPYAVSRKSSSKEFTFGNQKERSLGYFMVRMPVTSAYFISFRVDVVNVNVPLLMGLDSLDMFKTVVDTVDNFLWFNKHG